MTDYIHLPVHEETGERVRDILRSDDTPFETYDELVRALLDDYERGPATLAVVERPGGRTDRHALAAGQELDVVNDGPVAVRVHAGGQADVE